MKIKNKKQKRYSAREIKKMGYNLSIPLNNNEKKLFSNQYLRLIITKKEGEIDSSIEDVAIKKPNENYFTIAKSISHRPKNEGNLALLYTINYEDGKKEIIYLSEIEQILVKEDSGKNMEKIWKKLGDLNVML